MKLFTYFSIISLFISCSSISNKGSVENYTTAKSKIGQITAKSWVEAKNKSKGEQLAMENILEQILFYGIAGSSVPNALVKNRQIENEEYFTNLLSQASSYVRILSISQEDIYKIDGGYRYGFVCIVDYRTLRNKLEKDNIIRKFGEL